MEHRVLKIPRVIPSTFQHVFYKKVKWQDEYGIEGWSRTGATIDDAEVVSSEIKGNMHAPVLDVDFHVAVIPSSTAGHHHLYIDVPMSWRKYKRLLRSLAAAGVIEKGYARASIRRRHTAVRVPWYRKVME